MEILAPGREEPCCRANLPYSAMCGRVFKAGWVKLGPKAAESLRVSSNLRRNKVSRSFQVARGFQIFPIKHWSNDRLPVV